MTLISVVIERGKKMTRQDVLKIFPTATEEAINAMLASHHAELNQEKEKNKDLKDTSKELEAAQKELEELRAKAESGAPDDWQAQLDKLTKAYEDSQKTIKNMQLKNSLKEKGFSDEDADKFIKTMDEGGDIASVLGELKTNVIANYDKERMDKTPDPSGGKGDNGADNLDNASKLASSLVGDLKATEQANVLANYM